MMDKPLKNGETRKPTYKKMVAKEVGGILPRCQVVEISPWIGDFSTQDSSSR